jgi:hypothetical protein
MPTTTKEKSTTTAIRNRKAITDHVCDWMQSNTPSLSIDTLLTRPLDAMKMGVEVGVKAGRIKKDRAKRIVAELKRLGEFFGQEMDSIDDVCRAALSSRKRGDLKRDRY